jgi:hypothetical protein
MAGFIIHKDALITCPHTSGIAQADQPDTRVKVSGFPIMTILRNYTITLCPQNTPCTKATWTKGALRVTASGFAVAINNGVSICVPPGALKPEQFQQRVKAE